MGNFRAVWIVFFNISLISLVNFPLREYSFLYFASPTPLPKLTHNFSNGLSLVEVNS